MISEITNFIESYCASNQIDYRVFPDQTGYSIRNNKLRIYIGNSIIYCIENQIVTIIPVDNNLFQNLKDLILN